MSDGIIIAIISSGLTFLGVLVTVIWGNRSTQKNVKQHTDLTLYRIEMLERKQDKHNTLIERMYACEDRLDVLDERQKVANHRIEDLEQRTV